MSSSEVRYHIDEENQQVIAERNGRAVGIMAWSVDGQQVTLARDQIPVCVAAHERRQGVMGRMTDLVREKFPREDGFTVHTTPAISDSLREVLNRPSMKEKRDYWLDSIGEETASEIGTPGVTQVLARVQPDLDRLLGK